MEVRDYCPRRSEHAVWRIEATSLCLLVLVACSKKPANDDIIAIVGDRIITTDEFIRRPEYTIRPPHRSMNSNVEKMIVLNSLILEKLFTFEAGDNNPLAQSPRF